MKPFGWWWNKYLKCGAPPDAYEFGECEELFYIPRMGFMCWKVTQDKNLLVTKLCGNGLFWQDIAIGMCRAANLRYVIFRTCRDTKALARRYGCEVFDYEKVGGRECWWMSKEACPSEG